MSGPWRALVGLAVVALAAVGLLWWSSTGEPRREPEQAVRATLVIGSVSQDVEDDVVEYQPMADYLAQQLASFGYVAGEVAVAPTTVEMARLVRQGKVDLYIDSPFPTFAVDQLTRSEPLVNRWKSGVETYRAVVYTRADSGVTSVGKLAGRVIAFEHPASTSGYFLPKAVLLEQGYTLREVDGPAAEVPPSEIGYYFVGGDNELMEAVAKGEAVAGAQNETQLQEFIDEQGGEYRFLLTTPSVFRHVVTAAEHLDPMVREAIKETLVTMHTDEQGQALLAAFKKTAKFTPFEPTPAAAYAGIEELLPLVEKEIVGS
ncbi:MAG: phosphate/phosphite/phosphonate ABC transporter substrate-binding protein [Candidatus Andersenbacteria bacterium]|nr:phosphate/phosphite/phosphonate ABC transporter substrate-binding protein [Candidatus Andersenbacteria bacterium]